MRAWWSPPTADRRRPWTANRRPDRPSVTSPGVCTARMCHSWQSDRPKPCWGGSCAWCARRRTVGGGDTMGFLDALFRARGRSSGAIAKERLQLVLVHDRMQLSPQTLQDLKDALIEAISRYVD